MFNTKGARVHAAHSCRESNQDEASHFPKEQMAKKKQMMEAKDGVKSQMSSVNQKWAPIEAITHMQWNRIQQSSLKVLAATCGTQQIQKINKMMKDQLFNERSVVNSVEGW